jgi:hypothetical protein
MEITFVQVWNQYISINVKVSFLYFAIPFLTSVISALVSS